MTAARDGSSPKPTKPAGTRPPKPWMVQRADREEPQWWAIPYGWSADLDQAMRFSRLIDAQAFIDFFNLGRVAFATDRPAGGARPVPVSEAVEAAQRREALERIRMMVEGAPGDSVYDPSIYVSPAKTFYADMRLVYAAAVAQAAGPQAGGRLEASPALVDEVAQIILGTATMERQTEAVQIRTLGKARAVIDAVRQSLVTESITKSVQKKGRG